MIERNLNRDSFRLLNPITNIVFCILFFIFLLYLLNSVNVPTDVNFNFP